MRVIIFISFSLLKLSRSMATDIRPPRPNREKVMLKPGFHLVDWMKLTQVSKDMRDGGPLRKISAAELSEHKSQFDCWTAYKGKVYNITQYIAYHPGGAPLLMEGAGKDCTVLFNKYHAWVNAESMLSKCLIGVLMSEEPTIPEGEENDEVDTTEESDIREKSVSYVKTVRLSGQASFDRSDMTRSSLTVQPLVFTISEEPGIKAVTTALEDLAVENGDL